MGNCCRTKTQEGAFQTILDEKLIEKADLPLSTQVVVVRLERLADIPEAPSLTGNTDCFVDIKMHPKDPVLGEQLQKSSIIPNSTSPKWEPPEKFRFYRTTVNPNSRIIISAYHYNPRKPAESIALGYAVIKFKDLVLSPAPVSKEINIITTTGKHIGEAHVMLSAMTLKEVNSSKDEVVYEFERWKPVINWGNSSGLEGHLLPTDPGCWCTYNGKRFGFTIDEVSEVVPDDWEVTEKWSVRGTDSDPDGWQYAMNFDSAYWYPEPSTTLYIRRRAFTRHLCKKGYKPPTTNSRSSSTSSRGSMNPLQERSSSISASGRRQRMFTDKNK